MARGIVFVALGLTGWLALSALSGCNEVLDIEQAQPRGVGAAGKGSGTSGAGSGNTSSSNTPVPKATCNEPLKSCSQCIASKCPTDRLTCLQNGDCRYALDEYRSCLGATCTDTQDLCAESFLETGRQLGTSGQLAKCATVDCAAECQNSPLATTCELYCSCMTDNCSSELPNSNGCLADCMANITLENVECRFLHCVIAKEHPSGSHCQHALGMLNNCVGAVNLDCGTKRPAKWACKDNTDCCSGECADTNLCK